MKKIDIENWNRKEHYNFFSSLDDPYWSITTQLECTHAYNEAKKSGTSFFLKYLHSTLWAVNEIEALKMRIVDDEIHCYDTINASATILRDDETFGCCFIEYTTDFNQFESNAQKQIAKTKCRQGMCLEMDYMLNQIHFSTIPWVKFSALTYAKSLSTQDTVPKITFGKYYKENNKMLIPISVQVNHALVDGIHVAKLLDKLQAKLRL